MKYCNLLIILFLFGMLACTGEKKEGFSHELVKSDKKKSFSLDDNTRYNAFYLYTFNDNRGKEYLSFLNYRSNQILFYDFETGDFQFKTEMNREGADGISLISGYYIKDFDNMYVTSYDFPGIIKIDTSEHIVQKIPYGTTSQGYTIVPSYAPSSRPFIPPVFVGDKLFITQIPADHIYPAAKTPVSVSIDTLNGTSEEYPFTFGQALADLQQNKETRFSRTFNGKNFIYSFYADENIYVASIDHKEILKVNAKSKYIDAVKFKSPPEDANLAVKHSLETACYGDLIYDKYRDVYYRFVYPETELEDNKQWIGNALFGRKKFSIIILDNKFNRIGETLFPEAIYNSYVFFIHKDGLYISSDYQINYDQPEDAINFELFRLTKNES